MFKRILVPLDGSSRAEDALPVAARIASASGGSIHVLRVVTPPVIYEGGLGTAPLLSEQMIEDEMAVATDYLKTVAALPKLSGIETTTEVAFGLPAQNILAILESQGIDLVVLCSHGRTGFIRWALGSVAHTLAHESMVPTLVLRASNPASLLSSTNTTRPPCVLVPLDGSALSEAALIPAVRMITALAAPAPGALHLAQVVKLYPAAAEEGSVSEFNEEALQHARTYLAQVMEHVETTMKDLKLSLTSSVELENDVSSALLHVAEHGGAGKEASDVDRCDLIAISTHGRGGLERWVMGSVTDRLLTSTTLPILIVRPQKRGPKEGDEYLSVWGRGMGEPVRRISARERM